MNGKHFILAILVAVVITWLTDWLFTGVLFHRRYLRYPEVWRRPAGGSGESSAVAWACGLGVLTCGAFVAACSVFHIFGYVPALEFAVLIWLIAPLPLTISNALFIKIDPLIVASHSFAWLVKLGVSAVAVGWLLR